MERASALGATKPRALTFSRDFLYRQTKAAGRGTGYDPTRPQKTWRSAWRVTGKGNRPAGGQGSGARAVEAGRGWRAGIEAWKRAAAQLRGLRFHDLRHLAITKLAECEASDQTIMSIAGHLDRSMLEHYSHIRAAAKRKAVDTKAVCDPLLHSRGSAGRNHKEGTMIPSVYIRVYISEFPLARITVISLFCWSGRGDLNARPPAPKAGALPGCATPRHLLVSSF